MPKPTKPAAKAKPKPAPKTGRPTKFEDSIALRILDLAKAGRTEEQIAAEIGISKTTLTNWKAGRPDFLASLKAAKNVADELVEMALFRRAVGYSMPDIRFFFDAKNGKIIHQAYTRHHEPDTTACIFWLKNRRPDLWRDKRALGLEPEASLNELLVRAMAADGL